MSRTLFIFDFDDTLVFSGAVVHVRHKDGTESHLESHEFATYVEQPGDEFDFAEFDTYPPSGRIINKSFNALKQAIASYGAEHIVVLSARGKVGPMQQFLEDNGLRDNVEIVGVASANPQDKVRFVDQRLQQGNGEYTDVIIHEDSMTNIQAIGKMISKKYPNVTYTPHHVQAESLLRKTIHNLLKEITFCRK